MAPKYTWWKQWHDEHKSNQWFIERYYETVLNELDPNVVIQDLQAFGKDVVLLCYETPEKFCHRHIAAQWLNDKLSLNISEFYLKDNQQQFIF